MTDVLIPDGGWTKAEERMEVPEKIKSSWIVRLASKASVFLGRKEVPDVLELMSLHPTAFLPWLYFASRLMPYGKLPARIRELIILRVGWLCRCRYEWGQHIEIGQKMARLSDEDILNIALHPEAFPDSREQTAIRACDELIRQHFISTDTIHSLKKHFNKTLILEIMLLTGHYQMLAGILNSSGLELEPDIEAHLQAFNQRILHRVES